MQLQVRVLSGCEILAPHNSNLQGVPKTECEGSQQLSLPVVPKHVGRRASTGKINKLDKFSRMQVTCKSCSIVLLCLWTVCNALFHTMGIVLASITLPQFTLQVPEHLDSVKRLNQSLLKSVTS